MLEALAPEAAAEAAASALLGSAACAPGQLLAVALVPESTAHDLVRPWTMLSLDDLPAVATAAAVAHRMALLEAWWPWVPGPPHQHRSTAPSAASA